jgi:hypothetical protein
MGLGERSIEVVKRLNLLIENAPSRQGVESVGVYVFSAELC